VFQLEQQVSSSTSQQQQPVAAGEDAAARLERSQQTSSQLGEQALQSKLAALDQNIGKVYAALPPNAALVIVTGQGDTSDAVWQTELRYKRQQRLEGYQKWTTADEEAFAALSESAMKALCFVVVKQPQ
jgi:hypothetical protein